MYLFNRFKKKIKFIIGIIFSRKKIHKIPFLIKRIGTEYGGWKIAINNLDGSRIISCGAGEDISFDVDMAAKYRCKVYIVDPTPRSKKYVEKVLNRIGKKPEGIYNLKGNPDVFSYDLELIKKDQLVFIKKAIWKESKKLKFFCPKYKKNVSHSIVNFQNNYRDDSEFIIVDAINFNYILSNYFQVGDVPEILKLDIEGAEHEVLEYILKRNILPKQILCEFDELQNGSFRAFKRFNSTNKLLFKNGYKLFAREQFNFSYIKL